MLSLRCASALPLPSFPTLHPKPVTSPTLVLFPKHRATEPHRKLFATTFHPTNFPAKHPPVGIPPSTTFHEVSLSYCPLTCSIVLHTAHHFSPAVVIACAIGLCLHTLVRGHDLRGRLGLALKLPPKSAPDMPGGLASRSLRQTGLRIRTPHRERGAWQEIGTEQRSAALSHQQEPLRYGSFCCCDGSDWSSGSFYFPCSGSRSVFRFSTHRPTPTISDVLLTAIPQILLHPSKWATKMPCTWPSLPSRPSATKARIHRY